MCGVVVYLGWLEYSREDTGEGWFSQGSPSVLVQRFSGFEAALRID